jgi:hypothetical protein
MNVNKGAALGAAATLAFAGTAATVMARPKHPETGLRRHDVNLAAACVGVAAIALPLIAAGILQGPKSWSVLTRSAPIGSAILGGAMVGTVAADLHEYDWPAFPNLLD